jgi:hypothetical protein
MALDVSLLAKLRSLIPTGVPAQLNYESADQTQPRVWLQRSNDDSPMNLAGDDTVISDSTWTVEVEAMDPDVGASIAEALTAKAPAGMNGFRGMMAGTMVLGCFCENVSDDYQPRNLDLDDGYQVTAFNLRILN